MSLRLALVPYRAAFARPIATARGPWHERRGLWVIVRDADGVTGLGEVAPLPEWGTETLEEAICALFPGGWERDARGPFRDMGWVRGRIAAGPGSPPHPIVPPERRFNIPLPPSGGEGKPTVAWLDWLAHGLPPAARAGLELALLDWAARREGVPLAALFAPAPRPSVRVNALLTALLPAAAAREAVELVAAGYTTLKLKVGGAPLAEDLERLRAVRGAVGPAVALRLDANGAWERDAAARALEKFAALAPEYVEQPVAAEDPEGLAWVRTRTGVPVAADESLRDAAIARRLLASGIDALVLKPLALGFTACLALAREAEAAGKRVIVTSALDRGVGTLGALHLAAALQHDTAAGLATAGLFADGPLTPALEPNDGRLALPPLGLGLAPDVLKEAVA